MKMKVVLTHYTERSVVDFNDVVHWETANGTLIIEHFGGKDEVTVYNMQHVHKFFVTRGDSDD